MVRRRTDVNWADVRRRYLAGENMSELARTLGLSKNTIDQHRMKENWGRRGSMADVPVGRTKLDVLAKVERASAVSAGRYGEKRSDAARSFILAKVECGEPPEIAAKSAGFLDADWAAWLAEDDGWRRKVEAAHATVIGQHFRTMYEAARDNKDMKALAWRLEKDRLTRGIYGAEEKGKGGASIKVVLNIPMPGQRGGAVEIDSPMVDVTPEVAA